MMRLPLDRLFRFTHKNHIYKDPVVNRYCKVFEVNNWIISEFIIKEIIPIVGISPYPLNELLLMVASVCRLKPAHIFEWGTNIGKSARIFFETVEKFRLNTKIYSIDLPDGVDHIEHPKANRGNYIKGLQRVLLYQGDGLEKSLEIYSKLKRKPRVLFFLDGDHEYTSVLRELKGIMENVPLANILVHDTFYQSPKSRYNIGPHKAIKTILHSVPKRYAALSSNTGLPGMTLIYPKNYRRTARDQHI